MVDKEHIKKEIDKALKELFDLTQELPPSNPRIRKHQPQIRTQIQTIPESQFAPLTIRFRKYGDENYCTTDSESTDKVDPQPYSAPLLDIGVSFC